MTLDFSYLAGPTPAPAPRLLDSGKHSFACPVWKAADPVEACRCRVGSLLTTAERLDHVGVDEVEEST